MPNDWDRQPDETPRAYQAFVLYRDLPPETRSLNTAWRSAKPDAGDRAAGTWTTWSTEHRWVERAAAYDEHVDSERLRARLVRIRQLEARRVDFELANQARLERRVARIEAVLDKADAAPITDIVQDKTVDGVTTRTKIRGFNFAGYGKLATVANETARQAINGLRVAVQDDDDGVTRITDGTDAAERLLSSIDRLVARRATPPVPAEPQIDGG